MAEKVARSENTTTPEVRVTFPNIFKCRSYQGGKPAKDITLLFDKKNEEHKTWLRGFKAQIDAVLAEQWPDPKDRPRRCVWGDDTYPIKDADKNKNQKGIPFAESYPERAGHFFIKAVKYPNDSNPNADMPIVDSHKAEILNAGEIYSGCYCKVNLNCSARTRTDNPGISVWLNGVQKIKDGERIGGGGGPSVDDMFEASGSDDPLSYNAGEKDFFGSNTPVPDDDVPF